MKDKSKQELEQVAESVADGDTIAWHQARDRLGDTGTLRGLQLLEQVGKTFRQASGAPDREEMQDLPFSWGPLQVIERLDEGSFGIVYRAHDPHLGRDVALKLRKASAAGDPAWLDEARRLARIRHEHVLTVHGAASHDGQDGFWSDLIDGEDLAARLRRDGPLDALELVAVGTTLCRALGALHAGNVVHGDVKAANVLREEGGRLVLVDLGSSRELGSDGAVMQGSPSSAAPEVLRGGAPTPAADLYGLASLLYNLATGALPTAGASWDQLVDPQRAAPVSLGNRRADLPAALTMVIDRGLAIDPQERFSSAGQLESALLAAVAPSTPASRGSIVGWRWYLGGALLVIVALVAGGLESGRAPWMRDEAPPVDWIQTTLIREGVEATALRDGATVRPGDRLELEIELDRQAHLYIANEDDAGNVFALFPLPNSSTTNPLPPGRHRLPGMADGLAQSWVVTSAGGRERFLIVAAASPLPMAERFLRDADAATASRPIQSKSSVDGDETLRGIGGVTTAPQTGASKLDNLRTRLRADEGPDVWLRLIQLDNPF